MVVTSATNFLFISEEGRKMPPSQQEIGFVLETDDVSTKFTVPLSFFTCQDEKHVFAKTYEQAFLLSPLLKESKNSVELITSFIKYIMDTIDAGDNDQIGCLIDIVSIIIVYGNFLQTIFFIF